MSCSQTRIISIRSIGVGIEVRLSDGRVVTYGAFETVRLVDGREKAASKLTTSDELA